MRKIAIIALMFWGCTSNAQQPAKVEPDKLTTKMERFTSRTGVILKTADKMLPMLKTKYDECETRIRKIGDGANYQYFYQIDKKNKYGNVVGSVEHSDLLELIKAINVLKAEALKGVDVGFDYQENRFITVDGFEVGYFIEGKKASWYITLKKYGSDNTLFIEDFAPIEKAFLDAKSALEAIKK